MSRLTPDQVAWLRDLIHHDCGEWVRPIVRDDAVPTCDQDTPCPSYDGKRCRQTGFRPGDVCEPAVAEMIAKVVR